MTLVAWGWVTTPGVNWLGVSGAYLILFVYALVGLRGIQIVERAQPPIAQWIVSLGLLAGLIFAGSIALEYVLLPTDNFILGSTEFGLAFLLYFLAGLLAYVNNQGWRDTLAASIGASMLASLLWLVATLFTFYLFRQTPPQQQVLFANGSFDDFVRSGRANFDIFVMEGLFRNAFVHLLLAPLVALFLGLLSGLAGKLALKLRSGGSA